MVKPSLQVPRRGLLLASLKGAIAATVLAIFYPVIWFLRPRKETRSGAFEVVAPFRLRDLVNPSAPIANPFDFAGKPCLIVITQEGAQRVLAGQTLEPEDVKAFNAICTHVDCTVKYRPAEGDIFCSCHEGVYDLSGRNISGPPPRPLESYHVALRGERGQEDIVVSRQT